ncbi:MAG: RidA family protein [Amaricoccus sp.]|uniref:RidA family protein n=1 Tax=Amaricoccus sp. TaxID=1872485 RepID=UPI0039E5E043
MRTLISSGSPYEARLGYSRAVVAGDWCFVSGCTGLDPATGEIPADVGAQAAIAFRTIETALGEAGFTLGQVVRVQYTVTDRSHVAALEPVLGNAFGAIRPAATMVFAGLIHPDMKVEIEVTALRG